MKHYELSHVISQLRVRRATALVTALWFSMGAALGLDPDKAISQYRQDVWTERDGLPQSSVQAITQTPDGYLWIGTRDGLARFDGVTFTVFDAEHHAGLGANDIRSLYVDRAGDLWIGTFNGGVSRYRDGQLVRYAGAEELPSAGVLEMAEDREGNLWMGTWSGAVKWTNHRAIQYTPAEGLAGLNAWTLCVDPRGAVWVGTSLGLNRLEDGKCRVFTAFDGVKNHIVRKVYVDRKGILWIGTIGAGLVRYDGENFQHFRMSDGLADNKIRNILEDSKGNLWIATWGGLSRMKDGRFTSYTTDEGLPHSTVEALFEDREGSLWVGTRGGGLVRLRDGKFTVYTSTEGLGGDLIKCVLEASDGSLWVGSNGGGLSCRRDGTFIRYTTKEGLSSNIVRALAEDREGNIWVGTGRPLGLSRFGNGRFITYGPEDGLKIEQGIRALYADRKGDLWVGGDGGNICRYRNGVFEHFSTADGLPSALVRVIAEDGQGNIWFGSNDGLCRYRNGAFAVFGTEDGLSHNAVYAIHEDEEGTLWVGTQRGLSKYRNGKFSAYTTGEGLHQNIIFQVLEDGRGNLWMSSNRGVFSLPKSVIADFDAGRIASLQCRSFGVVDGMKSAQCEGGSQPAGCKSRDGSLWFPTVHGVAMIHPDRIVQNLQAPPVHITALFASGKTVDLRGPIHLEPGTRDFRIQYTALSFVAPEKVRFRYRLEGFDANWIDADTRRFAVYNDLPPGNYRFRVSACNNDGVWNEAGAMLAFSLAPHFYQTSWFYTLCAAVTGMAAWSFHRHRMKQARARFSAVLSERNRIARELHDTLAQGFAGIAFQLEAVATKLTETPAQAQQHLNLALTMVRHSLSEARRSVMNLRSNALENGDLNRALVESARQMVGDRAVDIQIETRGNVRALPGRIENDLLRVGQEAMTNSLRHAQPSRLRIDLEYEVDRVLLRVADNGTGFAVADLQTANGAHFGLLGMRERAKQMGARFEVKSEAGSGTEIVLEVPTNQ